MRYADLKCGYEIKADAKDESKAWFTGVASTSDVDKHNDVISPGAFDPIAWDDKYNRPDVAMYRDHDSSQTIGGWHKFEQVGRQLKVEGALLLTVAKARETYDLMKHGYMTGISVGFRVQPGGAAWDEKSGRRTITKAHLLECSIVSMPANPKARIRDIKADGRLSRDVLADWLAENGFTDPEIELAMSKGFEALLEVRRKPLITSIASADEDDPDDDGETLPDGTRAGGDDEESKQGSIPSGMRKPKEDEARGAWMSYCVGELRDQGFTGDERMAICLRAFREGDRPRTTKERNLKPWGDVDYADPGYQDDKVKRYPIHRESNIRAAWSYINMPRNQRPYTSEQVAAIKRRIVAAWKRKIDPDGPPGAKEIVATDLASEVRSLVRCLQEKNYVR